MKFLFLCLPFLLGLDSPSIYKKQYTYFESDFLDEHIEIFKFDQNKKIVWQVYITKNCRENKNKAVRALEYYLPSNSECELREEVAGIFIFSLPKEEIKYAEYKLDVQRFLEWEKKQNKKGKHES